MAERSIPPVIAQMRELLTWLLARVAAFPRAYRFVLGERIGTIALDVLEGLLEAAFRRDKRTALERANLDLEKLRHLLRTGCELKCLSLRQYEYAARHIDEVGRMVGGWIKQGRSA